MSGTNSKSGGRWKAILSLCVIIPMIFLVGFKFSGLSNGPLTLAQTTTQEPVIWESERPSCGIYLAQQVDNSFFDAGWLNSSVFLANFLSDFFLGGSDVSMMDLNVTADLTEGYIQNITITFQGDYLPSWVTMESSWTTIQDLESGKPSLAVNWENLSLAGYRLGGQGNIDKGFIEFLGQNYSDRASISIWPLWVLEGSHNETQQLTIRFETTYFDGTEYKKLVQPFLLKFTGDNEDTFGTAREVTANQTIMDFIGGGDPLDFFKISLEPGEVFNVTIPPSSYDWTVIFYLYGPDDENHPLANSSIYHGDSLASDSIVYSISSPGWYYVKVKSWAGNGPYSITFTTLTAAS